jgi:uncharacterized integral membrane protein (TIGR00698 family)
MSSPSTVVSNDPYENPELFRFAGSMEGLPEWGGSSESADEGLLWAPWQERGNQLLGSVGSLLPGLTIALGVALLGRLVADWAGTSMLGFERSPVSPILMAIFFGLLIRNTVGLPSVYQGGVVLCLKPILRIGVALLGIRLSLSAVGAIGLLALPIVIACITTALLLVSVVNRGVGLPRRLGTLVAVGTAVCGNTAIIATGPVIRADEDEISYSVGCVTVFGLLALVTYPFLSQWVFDGDARLAGFFLGTAIHDTAQVAGAGLLYLQQFGASEALETATVTKLVRNLFMILVIPLMGVVYHRRDSDLGSAEKPRFHQMLPLFVFGFVAMALVRTIGDLGAMPFGGLVSVDQWESLISSVSRVSPWCLTIAMASVGLGTSFSRLRKLGLKPLGVGLAAALTVGVVSASLIHIFKPWFSIAGS